MRDRSRRGREKDLFQEWVFYLLSVRVKSRVLENVCVCVRLCSREGGFA